MSFKYFTKEHAKQQLFFKMPKALMYQSKYKGLSSNAKIIYSFMLDRLNLSIDNDWCDSLNNYYIVCEVDEVELLLSCSRKTAIKVIKELETFELIKKAKSGNGNSNILYIAQIETDNEVLKLHQKFHKTTLAAMKEKKKQENLYYKNRKCKKYTIIENTDFVENEEKNETIESSDFNDSVKSTPSKVYFLHPNKTDVKETDVVVVNPDEKQQEKQLVDNVNSVDKVCDILKVSPATKLLVLKFNQSNITLTDAQIKMLDEMSYTLANKALDLTIVQNGISFSYFYKIYVALEENDIEEFKHRLECNTYEEIIDMKKADTKCDECIS